MRVDRIFEGGKLLTNGSRAPARDDAGSWATVLTGSVAHDRVGLS